MKTILIGGLKVLDPKKKKSENIRPKRGHAVTSLLKTIIHIVQHLFRILQTSHKLLLHLLGCSGKVTINFPFPTGLGSYNY